MSEVTETNAPGASISHSAILGRHAGRVRWRKTGHETADAAHISRSAQAMGRVGGRSRSAAKALAARINGKRGGKPRTPLNELACICDGPPHKAACPRGHAIRRRWKGKANDRRGDG